MNKRMIFKIAGLAALFAADTAISIFSVRTYYKNKYEKISQDEISQMREYYNERLEKAKQLVEIAEMQAQDISLYRKNIETYKTEDPAESEHPEDDVPSPEVALDLDGENLTKLDWEDRGLEVEEIHISQFGERTEYATETLTYYIYDDILVDEQEMMIDRPEDLVGGVLLQSGFTQDGRENIYIRNYRLRTDYEIVKAFASFQDYS